MTKPLRQPIRLGTDPVLWLATGFGAGLIPWAPGTAGTVVGVVLYLPMAWLAVELKLTIIGLTFIAGCWICQRAERALGHDNGAIVLDEVVGYWVTVVLLPPTWPWLLAGFALFRCFDIWKPWPVRRAEHLKLGPWGGGFAVMLDDVVAGVYGFAVLAVVGWLWIRDTLVLA